MVISGEEGITKPDRRVFDKAIDLLGSDVGQIVFVDDYPGTCVRHAIWGSGRCGYATMTKRGHPTSMRSPT